MSSPIEQPLKKKKRNSYSEDDISKFSAQYDISYISDKEKLVSDLAIKGQTLLKEGNFSDSKMLSDFLLDLGYQWKDDFTKMKAYLLKANLGSNLEDGSIYFLNKALKLAKKLKYNEIIVGVRIQLAYEFYHRKELKKVLRQISEIERFEPLSFENLKVIYELKARCYWEQDNYIKGFEATYKWFGYLKDTDDIYSMFIVVVYLLTVLSSLELPIQKEKIVNIKEEIEGVLGQLAVSPHLYQELIPNLDTLFAKSLMMVDPAVLYEFTDMLLQSVRWMDEEKFLFTCLKLADAFYNIDDTKKAVELVEKSQLFIKDKKYDKLKTKINLKKVEFTSLIFYFMAFDPLYDPSIIKSVSIAIGAEETKYKLQTFNTPINSYATTSYSHILRILEKTKTNIVRKENSFTIEGLNEHQERNYFILRLNVADSILNLLFREDFQIDETISTTLHSTVSPFYSLIGVLLKDEIIKNFDAEAMENILLDIQRAINCPASDAEFIFPKKRLELDLLVYSSNEGGFKSLREHILNSALSFKQKYPFLKNPNFLQIFNSDPITLFDFSLRNPEQLESLSLLLRKAYGLNIPNSTLSNLFKDTMDLFLKKGETRYWKDFFYHYAWLQQKGTFLNIKDNSIETKGKLVEDLIFLADKLDEEEKILESRYFRLYLQLITQYKDFQKYLDDFNQKVEDFTNEKYRIIYNILDSLFNTMNLDEHTPNLIDQFCKLVAFDDWKKILDLFLYLTSNINDHSKLLQICEKKDVELSGYLIYLHFVKKLIDEKDYSSAFKVLSWVLNGLNVQKKTKDLMQLKWKYVFVTANMFLHDILPEIKESQLKSFNYSRTKLVDNLLDNYEWILDPKFLVQILIEKIEMLLQKSDFALAEKHYTWIEQLMFYHWNIFSSTESKDLIENIQQTKKKIISQHFI